jgi:p-cumate 2,3-dioxygenase beta subunit
VISTATVSLAEVEEFLFREADLLDEWKLEEWTALFTEDGQYLVPPLDDPKGDPTKTLFLIYDDRHRLQERAKRLLNKAAHSEFPHSRTTHLVSNVRIVDQGDAQLVARCNFIVTRAKGPVNDTYPGRSTYHLVQTDAGLRIRIKRAALDLAVLRPQGKVSIIL